MSDILWDIKHEAERLWKLNHDGESTETLGVLDRATDEIEGLRRDLNNVRSTLGRDVVNENIRLKRQHDNLYSALSGLLDVMEPPPDANCSCHLSAPCNDCVNYSGLREALALAQEALTKTEGV